MGVYRYHQPTHTRTTRPLTNTALKPAPNTQFAKKWGSFSPQCYTFVAKVAKNGGSVNKNNTAQSCVYTLFIFIQ